MDVVGTKEVMSTYGFSPMAVAATTAALQVIDEEHLCEKAREIERVFLEVTAAWKIDKDGGVWNWINYVTGVGADLGIWLKEDLEGGQVAVRDVCAVCLREGLLVFPNHRRIRMSVAMVITEGELRKGLGILKSALSKVLGKLRA
jgi:ornithine--oxo-acid transaminase